MDASKYKALFLQEAGEHISSIEEGLLSLESRKGDLQTIDDIFRGFHSIKGMSASMGYDALVKVSHAMEDLLSKYRKKKMLPAVNAVEILLEGLDCLKNMVRMVSDEKEIAFDVEEFIATVKERHAEASGKGKGEIRQPEEEKRPQKLELPKTIKVDGSLFDGLLVVTGELLAIRSGLREYAHDCPDMELRENVHRLGKSLERLYTMILAARMVPVEDLTRNLPRMVRDLSREGHKEVELNKSGTEIKLDKLVLEKMGDPLIHLIRNAIDHGIESQDERRKREKPLKGRLSIGVRRAPNSVVMEIRDDGRGIDVAGVREKASKMGIPRDRIEKMSEKEIMLMTCLPGMSLAKEVTDISGRGVGMDIVKEGIESVGGSLEIDSEFGKGTTMRVYLPLSVSIIKVLTVHSGEEMFALPLAHIIHIVEMESALLHTTEQPTVEYNDDAVPVRSLGNLLGMGSRNGGGLKRVVLVDIKKSLFGLEVDGTGEE
ncbi:MAG: chemotaxis protein CheA, partial [Thermodesulfobacteriota bacterium]